MNIDYNALIHTTVNDLREKITPQTYSFSKDSHNNRKVSYADWPKAIHAKVRAIRSLGSNGQNEMLYTRIYSVTVRYNSATKNIVKDDHIKRADGTVLELLSAPVDAENRHEWIVFECREWVP